MPDRDTDVAAVTPKRECPVPYADGGSWMGDHFFVFYSGTNVELGMDAEYRCEYCGAQRIPSGPFPIKPGMPGGPKPVRSRFTP